MNKAEQREQGTGNREQGMSTNVNDMMPLTTPVPRSLFPDPVRHCAAQHFGPWMVEPAWFERAVASVKAGLWPAAGGSHNSPSAGGKPVNAGNGRPAYHRTADGIAILSVEGQLTKGESSFGGCSTVLLRQAIRQAVRDPDVAGLMLLVDSPGGTVAGTAELAADVAAAARAKPTHAHVEDLCASAALWIASQASVVTATPTSLVGSIGTVAVVEDSSGQLAKEGVVVHVISTGAYKGAFTPGTKVTPEQLAYLQSYVDGLNEHFIAGVAAGRRITGDAVRAIADGRIHLAAQAKALGLLDGVCNQDQAMADLRAAVAERLFALGGLAARAEAQEKPIMSLKEMLSKISAAIEGILLGAAPAALKTETPQAAAPAPDAAAPTPPAAVEPAKPVAVTPAAVAEPAAPAAPVAPPPSAQVLPMNPEAKDSATTYAESCAAFRAELNRFMGAFGVNGATWLSEGKTFAEAQALHAAVVKAERDALVIEVKDLKAADQTARGAPRPVSFSVGETPEAAAQADLSARIGPNLSRVVAGMRFAPKGKDRN